MQSLDHVAEAIDLVNRYTLAGLAVVSAIELPELLPGARRAPDVMIRTGRVPAQLAGLVEVEEGWWAGPGAVIFELPHVGRFLIQDGCRIIVEPVPGCDPASIRLFLLGSALGALFHQRGLLPLHAGGIAVSGHCVAFGGDSGVGKSTLGACLRRRGYRTLADDVLVIDRVADAPLALPGYPLTKLWADTARFVGVETAGLLQVDNLRDKFYVEIDRNASFCDEPLPLARFYVLAETDGPPVITRLSNAEAMAVLTRNTYRAFLLDAMGRWAAHFAACAALVRQIGVYRLARRRDLAEMDAVVDLLETHFDDSSV